MNRHNTSRGLLILALALLLLGLTASAIYWTVSGAEAVLVTQEDYGEVIAAAAGGAGEAAFAAATDHWNQVNRTTRRAETHAHVLFFCILLILFSVLSADASCAGQRSGRLAWLAAGGVLIYPSGLLVQAAGFLALGQILSGAGAVLILLFTGRVVVGLFRPQKEPQPSGTDAFN